jgi:4-hydroxybenzoate polyprenyltransferase
MVIIVIASYMVLAIFEFVPLYKEKQFPDLWVNGALFFLSFVVGILLCIGVDIPSPSTPIREVVISIFGK